MRRKVVSTSLIRADVNRLAELPHAEHYELTFFKEADLPVVLDFLISKGATFGLHAPFIYRYVAKHPHPTTLDDSLRRDTYEKNRKCALLAKRVGAEYVVVHFPTAKQFDDWRSRREILDEVVREYASLNEIVPVRLENVYMNRYLYQPEDYRFFVECTGTTLCLDIGHLLIDSEVFGFSALEFLEKCEDIVSEVHVYYADVTTYERCHHAPWGESSTFLQLLEVVRDLDCDVTIEAGPDCPEGLGKLMSFFESL